MASLVPKIPGDVSDHFPAAIHWGVTSPINRGSRDWTCPCCGHDERLLVLGAGGVVFYDCLACWLGQPVQLGLFHHGQNA